VTHQQGRANPKPLPGSRTSRHWDEKSGCMVGVCVSAWLGASVKATVGAGVSVSSAGGAVAEFAVSVLPNVGSTFTSTVPQADRSKAPIDKMKKIRAIDCVCKLPSDVPIRFGVIDFQAYDIRRMFPGYCDPVAKL
jgi:hypothetical protein